MENVISFRTGTPIRSGIRGLHVKAVWINPKRGDIWVIERILKGKGVSASKKWLACVEMAPRRIHSTALLRDRRIPAKKQRILEVAGNEKGPWIAPLFAGRQKAARLFWNFFKEKETGPPRFAWRNSAAPHFIPRPSQLCRWYVQRLQICQRVVPASTLERHVQHESDAFFLFFYTSFNVSMTKRSTTLVSSLVRIVPQNASNSARRFLLYSSLLSVLRCAIRSA